MDLLSLIERHPPGEPPVPPGEPRPVHIARTVAANRSRGRPQQGATTKGGSRTPASDIYQEVVRALGGQGLDRERTAVANQVRRWYARYVTHDRSKAFAFGSAGGASFDRLIMIRGNRNDN